MHGANGEQMLEIRPAQGLQTQDIVGLAETRPRRTAIRRDTGLSSLRQRRCYSIRVRRRYWMRLTVKMNTRQNDEMPDEIDFSQGIRGRFYRPNATLRLPIYLDEEVHARLAHLASEKGLELSEPVNELFRKDFDLIEIAL